MRQLNAKVKDYRLIAIPDELREAMHQVQQLLLDLKQERDRRIDFDDAIQVPTLRGGRCGTNRRPFVFTYYPSDGNSRGKWKLTLAPFELEDIADGVMTHLKMYCCTSPQCQMKFREICEHCFHCDYCEVTSEPPQAEIPNGAQKNPLADGPAKPLIRPFRRDDPMTTPIGRKIKAAGYKTLWAYLDQRGFIDMDSFTHDIDFPTLAPVGFTEFIVACAKRDGRWNEALRILAAHELNYSRLKYRNNAASEDWILISPIACLSMHFDGHIAIANEVINSIGDYVRAHRDVFDRPVSWKDQWLVELVPKDS